MSDQTPVFVDVTGKRSRRLRYAAMTLTVLGLAYVFVLALSLLGAPGIGRLVLPGIEDFDGSGPGEERVGPGAVDEPLPALDDPAGDGADSDAETTTTARPPSTTTRATTATTAVAPGSATSSTTAPSTATTASSTTTSPTAPGSGATTSTVQGPRDTTPGGPPSSRPGGP